MKVGKLLVAEIFLLVILISNIPLSLYAQAQTFEQHIPNYGLYCKDTEVVKIGMVKFDMTDFELLERGTGVQKSEYQVTATNSDMEFVIPFISSAINCPAITVMVNEHRVEGSVWYGDGVLGTDNSFDIRKVSSPIMDESITGTLYTVIPDSDIINISLSFTERKSLIYETSNNFSSYLSEDGSHSFTLRNALSRPNYSFFVVGETTGHAFTSDCEYQTEILTCKEFVDVQYEKFKEYYEGCGGIKVEFLYSMVNKALSNKTSIRYDELFFSSIDTYRLNAFKFHITLDIDSVISYEIPVRVQRNYTFEPLIYLVEHKQTVDCPIKFVMELNNEIPHIIESNKEIESNGLIYTTETADDFYFVFSSSTNPLNLKTKSDNKVKKEILIICIFVGSVALITLVVLTVFTILKKKGNFKG